MTKKISTGVVHSVPKDLQAALRANTKALVAWNDLTPLARNEWICWVISVKKSETRHEHISRLIIDLTAGKRRPCCWYGCVHRKDKKVRPSVQKMILDKRKK